MANHNLLQELKGHSHKLNVVYQQLIGVLTSPDITEAVKLSAHANDLISKFEDFLMIAGNLRVTMSGYNKSHFDRLTADVRETCNEIQQLRGKIAKHVRGSFGLIRNMSITLGKAVEK